MQSKMKKLSVKEVVSSCCGAELKTWTSQDGTSFWVCEACDRASDMVSLENDKGSKNARNTKRQNKQSSSGK